ncbi:MAG TPA: methyltransferase [Solirubrobacteraceae bacterium]|nr:methyltransferase [Solirubrobacteraceae bacterium]
MGVYAYDQDWPEERRRVASMAALWDGGSQAVLERLGVGEGWRCLEVGAGGGSLASWLADCVGSSGHVLATDINTDFMEGLERDNLEILRHDILSDDLPAKAFDLIHARLVAEHLGTQAIDRMVPALAPGGILVLEDYDFDASVADPPDAINERVRAAVLGFMSSAGFDPHFGRRLLRLLESAGLEDIGADGQVQVYRGGSSGVEFFRLSVAALADTLVERGAVERAEVEHALAGLADPANVILSPAMISAWGRAPAGG